VHVGPVCACGAVLLFRRRASSRWSERRAGRFPRHLCAAGGMGAAQSADPGALDNMVASADVVFFDLASCPYCRKAERALKGAGIEFKMAPIRAANSGGQAA
jgi:hypothetical protein